MKKQVSIKADLYNFNLDEDEFPFDPFIEEIDTSIVEEMSDKTDELFLIHS